MTAHVQREHPWCVECRVQFKNRRAHTAHRRKKHGVKSEGSLRCGRHGCTQTFRLVDELIAHLGSHGFEVSGQTLHFSSMEELRHWNEEAIGVYKSHYATRNIGWSETKPFTLVCNCQGRSRDEGGGGIQGHFQPLFIITPYSFSA